MLKAKAEIQKQESQEELPFVVAADDPLFVNLERIKSEQFPPDAEFEQTQTITEAEEDEQVERFSILVNPGEDFQIFQPVWPRLSMSKQASYMKQSETKLLAGTTSNNRLNKS